MLPVAFSLESPKLGEAGGRLPNFDICRLTFDFCRLTSDPQPAEHLPSVNSIQYVKTFEP